MPNNEVRIIIIDVQCQWKIVANACEYLLAMMIPIDNC